MGLEDTLKTWSLYALLNYEEEAGVWDFKKKVGISQVEEKEQTFSK